MKFHPIAEFLPMLPEAQLQRLAEDIKANGLRLPILIYEKMILDGRNRFKACELAGVRPRFQTYRGKEPLKCALSLNIPRRHLNESQRAIIGARLATKPRGRPNKSATWRILSQPEAAKLLSVSERNIQRAAAVLKDSPPEIIAEIEAGLKTVSEVLRAAKRDEVIKTVATMPSDKFRVIYADPPWNYGNTMEKGDLLDNYGSAEKHYATMTIKELCAMPVPEIVEENAVLFLWVTSPLLDECWPVIKSWGFDYKTSFVWDKVKHNMGHYNSVRHEFLLVCTRGSCTPDVKKLEDSVQTIERGEHSEKPERFREIIDTLYPHGKRIELFARKKTEGWETYGNEV